MDKNILRQEVSVSTVERALQKHQSPHVIWFTGLSGAGKSTLANALEVALFARGHHSFLLDGDNLRHGLNQDLGFSDTDRSENIRRVGEVAKLFTQAGLIVITAFISPFKEEREWVKNLVGPSQFTEIYLSTSLSVCEERDVKGLYHKARMGDLTQFTGIDSPYDIPDNADIDIDTAAVSVEESVAIILQYLRRHDLLAFA
jgi:adenylyl-sulfate kinase